MSEPKAKLTLRVGEKEVQLEAGVEVLGPESFGGEKRQLLGGTPRDRTRRVSARRRRCTVLPAARRFDRLQDPLILW